ncbi:MAG: dihydrolipoamide acetyltransferase family protein [Clostridia bacterium]
MATAIIMPRQGNTVESCIVSKWHVKKGDRVKAGDLLFTYETDKATFDAESTTDGTVLEIFFDVGDDVPVLTNMCVIGEPGEDITPFLPAGAKEEEKQAPSEEPVKEEEVSQPMQAEAKEPDEAIGISPRAKNLAIKAGADLSKAVPTGPKGRIIERDVRSLIEQGALISKAAMDKIEKGAEYTGTGLGGRVTLSDLAGSVKEDTPVVQKEAATPTPEYTEEPLSNIRKLIGKSMHQSLSEMAQLTLHSSFNATAIQSYRQKVKAAAELLGLSNITLNDIILFAVSRVIKKHKALNAHYTGTSMKYFNHVHLGMAVDTDRGLMVPTIFNADQKSLNEIAIESKKLAEACRTGKINPDLLQGGTFTVTNLGGLGVESFTPVINPPQTAILGVCNIVQRPIMTDKGISLYPAMGLSLTFDHRAVDGAPAAKFLKDLGEALESFELLMAI